MRPLSASDILAVWEQGRTRHPVDRALVALERACPELSPNDLIALPVGDRDTGLLRLRSMTFGDVLEGRARCAECNENLEFALSITELLGEEATPWTLPTERNREGEITVNGGSIRFRLPNSLDLAAATRCPDKEMARRLIAQRCVINEGDVSSELSEQEFAAIADRMAELDPYADITVALDCPACGAREEPLLDILSFFWSELSAAARSLLRDVHILARAYGWREADILAMSTSRRQMYIDMVL